ncbi:MAG TPA: helix-turn-helix domain-containing protein, partial [Caulobacteraceae bacterium]|nr:helix-turn-helix domain-containing protein [Caulobacteraceae bacterium]
PLRERRADVPLLFGHFLTEACARFRREPPRLTEAIRRQLLEHDWPGNVRELRHFADRVALGVTDIAAPEQAEQGALPERLERYERELICEALGAARGDVREALAALGIPRKTFYDKLQRHGIDINRYRTARSARA